MRHGGQGQSGHRHEVPSLHALSIHDLTQGRYRPGRIPALTQPVIRRHVEHPPRDRPAQRLRSHRLTQALVQQQTHQGRHRVSGDPRRGAVLLGVHPAPRVAAVDMHPHTQRSGEPVEVIPQILRSPPRSSQQPLQHHVAVQVIRHANPHHSPPGPLWTSCTDSNPVITCCRHECAQCAWFVAFPGRPDQPQSVGNSPDDDGHS